MTDVLADRCADLAEVTIDLMRVSMESQTSALKLNQVGPTAARMRAVVELGTEGIDNDLYLRWHATALATLAAMEAAADRGDARGVWDAFTDPITGLAGLGQACAGQPRW